ADAACLDNMRIGFAQSSEKSQVVHIGHIHAQADAARQIADALPGALEIGRDIRFYFGLLGVVETDKLHAGEIDAAALFEVGLNVAQEVDLLKGGAQGTGGRLQPLVQRVVALTKYAKAHQPDHFRRPVDVLSVELAVKFVVVQVHFHRPEKGRHVGPVDAVLVHSLLKSVQYGVETHPLIEGAVCVLFKLPQQARFVISVKTIHDLVGNAHKTVHGRDG